MGDHRADIKLEMTAHGKTYKTSMWINYWDDGNGCDQRIIGWFAESWGDAMRRWDAQQAEYWAEERAKGERDSELAELQRLKAKYPETR